MPRRLLARLDCSDWLRAHPRLGRLLRHDRPALWVPMRRTVALGAAIGAAVSVVPLPAQALMAALAAARLEAHLPTAVGLTFLSNPFTMLPLWAAAWMLGALATGQGLAMPAELAQLMDLPPTAWGGVLGEAGLPLLVGFPLLAALLALACFTLTHAGWRFAVARKWRSRRSARAA